MYRMIFRYRWAAMLFVFMVLGSTMSLVGTEKGDGQLAAMQRQVTEQRQQFEQTTADAGELPFPEAIELEDAEPESSFTEETAMVDPALGIDPTPDQPDGEGEADGTVELVNRGSADEEF